MGSLWHDLESSGSFVFAWIHSDAPSRGLVFSRSRGFPRTRLGVVVCRMARMVSLVRTYGSSGSFGFAWVHSGALNGDRDRPGSRRLARARLGVVGFIYVR